MRISNENRAENSTMKELQTRNIELEKSKRKREGRGEKGKEGEGTEGGGEKILAAKN